VLGRRRQPGKKRHRENGENNSLESQKGKQLVESLGKKRKPLQHEKDGNQTPVNNTHLRRDSAGGLGDEVPCDTPRRRRDISLMLTSLLGRRCCVYCRAILGESHSSSAMSLRISSRPAAAATLSALPSQLLISIELEHSKRSHCGIVLIIGQCRILSPSTTAVKPDAGMYQV